jgi:hypothetical protein
MDEPRDWCEVVDRGWFEWDGDGRKIQFGARAPANFAAASKIGVQIENSASTTRRGEIVHEFRVTFKFSANAMTFLLFHDVDCFVVCIMFADTTWLKKLAVTMSVLTSTWPLDFSHAKLTLMRVTHGPSIPAMMQCHHLHVRIKLNYPPFGTPRSHPLRLLDSS